MSHVSVLLHEAVNGLAITKGDIVLDGTLGGGGHTEEICKRFGADVKLYATDRDSDAIERSQKRLSGAACQVSFFNKNFRDMDTVVPSGVDKILLDLGLSSDQLDTSGRGFTFRKDEPLKMTMGAGMKEEVLTAEIIVNEWEESSIADIIYGYGEERYAKRIAKEIVLAREFGPIKTTFALASIIAKAVPVSYRKGRIHPATRTFQAIRIAVNDELGSLKEGLTKAYALLRPRGRIAVISFHSLEDRIVKHFFKDMAALGTANIVTKRPIVPTEEEIQHNPRARSAKLRILEKK
ncbi:MAG: 16S rRNA (cytosine(1402)-N(4))-methyltransferase RsmH [Candidatus Pacebacteria bacterium]|jgi:16S rRNA (cytosine1402-N4)-methyltransferase|nr:16S rRNA (cytosine(1402)-N(4))-methyltransferase RsmH [Candidatus Paceibacterota bacterium]